MFLKSLAFFIYYSFPKEYPFNKDGYRYIMAEADIHAPFRQEFDESTEMAGKPIPGFLCRVLVPEKTLLGTIHISCKHLKGGGE